MGDDGGFWAANDPARRTGWPHTWLVTGGAGYVGRYVVRSLLDGGDRAVVLDDLSTGDRTAVPAGVPLVLADVRDGDALRGTMRRYRVWGVLHLAARKSAAESVVDPVGYFRVNVDGTLAVVEAMLATGVRRIVLASSAAVYAPGGPVFDEAAPTAPCSPYGASKLAAEWVVRDAAAAHGLDAVILRYFNVAGGSGGTGLVPSVLAAGETPVVYGTDYPTPDGSAVRDYVHVEDVAAAHRVVASALRRGRLRSRVYNVGSGVGTSVHEVLSTVAEVTGRELAPVAEKRRPGDPVAVVASIDRIVGEHGWRPRHDLADIVASAARGRVVIVTASVGAGHDGAAAAWARRLAADGYAVDVHDLVLLLPAPARGALRDLYRAMLRRAPWTYGLLFRLAALPWGADRAVRALLAPYRWRIARLVTPDTVAVLSTYPLASQLIGALRRAGQLTVPTATFLTDFGVHRLWVAPGIDAHYALHEVSAAQARRFGAAGVSVTGPMVADGFGPASTTERRAARARFGLPAEGRLALLVTGSWGVGPVERAVRDIGACGVATPIVVCGRNEALRARLAAVPGCHALGWVEDMPTLLRAADVLVENAGGLTSLEALASAVPVATYRPIPGHGRANAAALERAGVSRWIRRRGELGEALRELLDGVPGRQQRRAGLALFASMATAPLPVAAGPSRSLPRRRVRRWIAAAAAAATITGLGATVGTSMAVAGGLHAARPGRTGQVFLVVRPAADTPLDAQTVALLGRLHAAGAVDGQLVAQQPDEVRALAGAGLTLVDAGGRALSAYRRAQAIDRLAGQRPRFVLSGRSVDAVDLATVSYLKETIVQPRLRVGCDGPPPRLHAGQIVLVDCADDPGALLRALADDAAAHGLPFGSLQELGS